MKTLRMFLALLLIATLLSSCAQSAPEMHDGYYTAEAAAFDPHGWKEYLTIYISDNTIVTVEYNAKNSSGFIKSWDMDYMRIMNAANGTYPNKYVRVYSTALLSRQNPLGVDTISGATHSHTSFQLLADAAIAQAKEGDRAVVFVDIPIPEDEETEG